MRDAVSTGNSALVDVRTALQMGCNDDNPEQLCVRSDQLQTTSIRINEQFDWTEQGRVSLGFEYRNSLLARIDGVNQAGLLIDTILIAGGDHVRFDGLDFTASGRAEGGTAWPCWTPLTTPRRLPMPSPVTWATRLSGWWSSVLSAT